MARRSTRTRTLVSRAVESPCIRLCTLDDDDICVGCHRSIDEICAWGSAGEAERRDILKAAETRRDQRQQRA